ncbi:hypothetical protein ABW19_dt0206264 [Dactylella cylindrospora]|nr:hypothetical protein ABW19_dt0206264 [Dactylella cylindrospora]
MAVSSRLERHLEQIEAAANDISAMKFSKPGIFTNSQIDRPPITSLIRDTSQYERVLFSSSSKDAFPQRSATPGNKSALLSSLLDGNVMQQMRTAVRSSQLKGEVDVRVLLQGAENLAKLYPTPGLDERIESLRARYQDLQSSVSLYEEFVAAQRTQLDLQRGVADVNDDYDPPSEVHEPPPQEAVTDAEIEAEEAAIRDLESKRLDMEMDIRELDRKLGSVMSSKGF